MIIVNANSDDDIFADWKRNKFIVAPQLEGYEGKHIIVLTDIKFWSEHADELVEWCLDHAIETSGMTLTIDTNEKLTLFTLRWS